ncbi:LamB/YcsF family protein [Lysinibacillus sp. NPDC092081]|uniref:LamB/YcsF family protein n=1 Tax=Lysinibacillus sp. NPDC092081 TaxID=3364131 RepID=UPI00380D8853
MIDFPNTMWISQVKGILTSNEVLSVQQKKINISAQTLCIHGDGPHALDYAKKL